VALVRLSRWLDDPFIKTHPKLRPVDTATGGVYPAGCCKEPNGIRDIIVQTDMLLKSAHPGRSRKAQEVASHRPRWG
jgi:heterodisulfide reductase subunit A-like polyferredoxin